MLLVVTSHSGFSSVPGGLGVTIFFFLSGYLITTFMLVEGEHTHELDIPSFYARRFLRLMPPLLVTLAVAYALTLSGLLPGGITAAGLAAQVLYFANYYHLFFDPGNTVPDGTGILWSLAVEEHFYILYPWLMAWLLHKSARPVLSGALLGLVCLIILLLAHSSSAIAGIRVSSNVLRLRYAYRFDRLWMHPRHRHQPRTGSAWGQGDDCQSMGAARDSGWCSIRNFALPQ